MRRAIATAIGAYTFRLLLLAAGSERTSQPAKCHRLETAVFRTESLQRLLKQANCIVHRKTRPHTLYAQAASAERTTLSIDPIDCGDPCGAQERFAGLQVFARPPLRFAQWQKERVTLSLVRGTIALGRLGQGPEQFEPLFKMAYSFQVGPAMKGSLTRSLPVWNCLCSQPSFCVVKCDQLRLSLHHLRELRFEDAGYAFVQNSAPFQQGRAGGDLLR